MYCDRFYKESCNDAGTFHSIIQKDQQIHTINISTKGVYKNGYVWLDNAKKMAAQPICYLSVAVLKTYDRKDFLMSLPYIQNGVPGLPEALEAYTFPEILLSVNRYGKGHINDTFCLPVTRRERYPIYHSKAEQCRISSSRRADGEFCGYYFFFEKYNSCGWR